MNPLKYFQFFISHLLASLHHSLPLSCRWSCPLPVLRLTKTGQVCFSSTMDHFSFMPQNSKRNKPPKCWKWQLIQLDFRVKTNHSHPVRQLETFSSAVVADLNQVNFHSAAYPPLHIVLTGASPWRLLQIAALHSSHGSSFGTEAPRHELAYFKAQPAQPTGWTSVFQAAISSASGWWRQAPMEAPMGPNGALRGCHDPICASPLHTWSQRDAVVI